VGFEVLTAVIIKSGVLWVVTLSFSESARHFVEHFAFHLQDLGIIEARNQKKQVAIHSFGF
jgi:hypothetical protein